MSNVFWDEHIEIVLGSVYTFFPMCDSNHILGCLKLEGNEFSKKRLSFYVRNSLILQIGYSGPEIDNSLILFSVLFIICFTTYVWYMISASCFQVVI